MSTALPTPRQDWALFLDLDGTLIDFAPTPDGVVVPAELRDTLAALHRALGGAVALVSGRALVVLDALFTPLILPASGQHGAELRLGGEKVSVPPHPAMPAIAVALDTFAAAHPGVRIENKGHSIAVHYRGAPAMADKAREVVDNLIAAAGDALEPMPGQMVIDIKRRGLSKGSAVAWFMARAPFAERVPVFIGDDRTDEDGFAAVNERRGLSIRIGSSSDTAASFCIATPAALREWLATIVRCYG
ncbi:MAG TPA: trehalose-phosphatase [Stellaceae bacterium]|jgi:trehalose 6-phosphate phosphatase|nr:trehalose-phosphatase [Stellaceae bacterium]